MLTPLSIFLYIFAIPRIFNLQLNKFAIAIVCVFALCATSNLISRAGECIQ